ncbi:hypothetical protein PY093_17510 [Cytobacillus sp. S13-E01]|uniref:hypothetical protein n=1 Tax=Cytobacillus sp. S13-E01 TaxID=3031326 RepID=UPI0023D8928E|nr:hypothetical protein [Cytobacillus sp. S13-E01]MDF0728438.1 hypothetical protein [Cytobacillus sp. S13-E01]
MVLQFDDQETISLVREDFSVHFICEKVKKAIERDVQGEIEVLDEENHEWLILYTIQPDPDEADFG